MRQHTWNYELPLTRNLRQCKSQAKLGGVACRHFSLDSCATPGQRGGMRRETQNQFTITRGNRNVISRPETKSLPFLVWTAGILLASSILSGSAGEMSLFDGKTLNGWTGDTNRIWRVENGTIVGGSLSAEVARNEFLATTSRYTNFVLKLQFKLEGKSGFINGGVQFRSERTKQPANEMTGYQADIGDPEWWGCLYDESRRNKVLAKSNLEDVNRVLKRGDWNSYEIRCEGKRIRLVLNGVQTVDYTEPEDAIPQHGLIALQIHGGAVAQISFKDIRLEVLP